MISHLAKFTFISTMVISLMSFALGSIAIAQNMEENVNQQLGAAAQSSGYGKPTDPRIIARDIIEIGLGLIGTIFFGLMLYAGFLWMTAGGNEENVEKATKLIKYAVIGLIIIVTAYSITLFAFKLAIGQQDLGTRERDTWTIEGI